MVSSDDKMWAFLSVFLGLIGFILAYALQKDRKYVMYYAKQSLMLAIISMALGLIYLISIGFGFLSMCLGSIISLVITFAYIGWIVLYIIGIIYSLSEEMKPIPLVGKLTDEFLKF